LLLRSPLLSVPSKIASSVGLTALVSGNDKQQLNEV
jgi:hypothetical protein